MTSAFPGIVRLLIPLSASGDDGLYSVRGALLLSSISIRARSSHCGRDCPAVNRNCGGRTEG